jgi:hypothetical protein
LDLNADHHVEDALSATFAELETGQRVSLRSLTDFTWDRVGVFGAGTSESTMTEALGVESLPNPATLSDATRLVFVEADAVVATADIGAQPRVYAQDLVYEADVELEPSEQ